MMHKLALIFVVVALCAEKSNSFSVDGKVKYSDDFTHFAYANPNAPQGGPFRLAELGSFEHINPEFSNALKSGRVFSFTLGTLMVRSMDEKMSIYCFCADSIDVAPDKKSVTFTINPKAEWDEGYGFLTADDILFSLEIWKKRGSIYLRSLYQMVEKVEKIDSKTVRFFFSSSTPTLPIIVGCMPLLCKKFYSNHGIHSLETKPMIALGPYKITDYMRGQYILYKKRQNFWGNDLPTMKGLFNAESIHVRYFRDGESMRSALIKGDVDSIVERSPAHLVRADTLLDNPKIKFRAWKHDRPVMVHLMVLNSRKAYLKDRRVRKALSLIFRHDILQRYFFQGVYCPISSLFQNTMCAGKDTASLEEIEVLRPFADVLPQDVLSPVQYSEQDDYRASMMQAKALLEESGWIMDCDKKVLRHKETEKVFPPLHIYCSNADERAIACDFQKRLQRVGIHLVLHQAEPPYLNHVMSSHTIYDIGFMRYMGTPFPGLGLLGVLHSRMANKKGSRNYAGVCHPAVDWLLQSIQNTTHLDKQIAFARALDRVVMHEHFFIPLFYTDQLAFWCWDHIKFPDPLKGVGYIVNTAFVELS
ncbi:MAG: ABC transporter substrate-binding protein [Alphaproteobacteria bacterium]|nr:ABC transporter substrate-binding protein [Alphaproteobacteria bacterium]